MMNSELINALMSHIFLNIERSYATAQISSIQDAIDFLRLEVTEGNELSEVNPVPYSQQLKTNGSKRFIRMVDSDIIITTLKIVIM
jgi:hypothetical protein